ncbi:DUF1697 domain-containing protein [Spongiimicrobium sp. 3-5]|uniref:DUF1697 domain-containing protein n=1 Tax=Spongiimicrobium sp. 3-5 TaxID=3332596 RepID=UPI00397F2357
MTIYIALLRGINVSGQKKIKMADLKQTLECKTIVNVITYIQSGNLVFNSNEKNTMVLEAAINKLIFEAYGFNITVLVLPVDQLKGIYEANPFHNKKDIEENRIYYVFLQQVPKEEHILSLKKETYENEAFVIAKRCIYLRCAKGYGKAKCNNNFFEKKLSVRATTRNDRTVTNLLKLAGH